MSQSTIAQRFFESRPWARNAWRPAPGDGPTLFWLVLIHLTAAAGILIVPWPGWTVFSVALALTWLGGIGTTVCYHRTLAHRSVRLHPAVRNVLTFFAILNGSGAPAQWTANHRLHHAKSDTLEDISSPRIAGFWWAHLRWIYQAGGVSVKKYCPDLDTPGYALWGRLQMPLLVLSYLGGAALGLAGFFWIGAIRLVFSLHAQCFVNSICHMRPGVVEGEDSSRNVAWLGLWHLFQGENWHRNHHAMPWSARLGWSWRQPDAGWWVIRGLEVVRLADNIKRPDVARAGELQVAAASPEAV